MDIRKRIENEIVYIDGGLGSTLIEMGLPSGMAPEKWNVKESENIIKLHKDYIDAGAMIITTNTFGANVLKIEDDEYTLEELVISAVKNAKEAIRRCGKKQGEDVYVGLSVGPCSKLLKPLGDLDFEDCVSAFSKTIKIGADAGADLIIIETMSDTYEAKAALLAAKESCNLPVFVTVTYDEKGKLMTGASPKAVIAMLEGLRADAIGINCGLGPKQMKEIVEEYVRFSSLPIILSPNAGMPKTVDSKTVYDIDENEFAMHMREYAMMGVHGLGGCCGTTKEHIKKVVELTKDISAKKIEKKNHTVVSSYSNAVVFSDKPVIVGERINPTGKKKLKEALRENRLDYILGEAVAQSDNGAKILDVNVGLPEIDEVKMLTDTVKAVQGVSDLPLQLDSSDPCALESAMRIYNGKPMINSVNGKKESMDAVFPLVKKYGGVVVALTLDENGIPSSSDERVKIALKIINEAKKYGIDKKDIVVDSLAMAVSSDKNSANVTIESVRKLSKDVEVNTILGVSNISFGLPSRQMLNSTFLTLCFENGLSSAIMNPMSEDMMRAYYSFCALKGLDDNFENYIGFASENEQVAKKDDSSKEITLSYAIEKGFSDKAYEIALDMLKSENPLTIINEHIIPALNVVGEGFEKNTVFLPSLLMSAESAKSAFDAVKSAIPDSGDKTSHKIIIATVKGDIHDIGKNIVKVLLENYGFEVIDLGKDVDPQMIVDAVIENDAKLLALSALMTTTVVSMEDTIKLLKEKAKECKVIVGGAVLTKEYADMINADFYAKDAMGAVRFAQQYFEC
ncbi:MAG: homocysteine S-methyltransferase family protein [Ruminococcus sp.]|nr:homocysteine S-methyltransferase family protein [Ruminococcus sp.]